MTDQRWFPILLNKRALSPLLEDIHVDGQLCEQVIDVDVSSLAVSPTTTYGLGHRRVIVVLCLAEHGGKEDDVVCALEVSRLLAMG